MGDHSLAILTVSPARACTRRGSAITPSSLIIFVDQVFKQLCAHLLRDFFRYGKIAAHVADVLIVADDLAFGSMVQNIVLAPLDLNVVDCTLEGTNTLILADLRVDGGVLERVEQTRRVVEW